MSFDNKNHWKKLIQDLADVLIEFIDEIPDKNDDLSKALENVEETKPVIYPKRKMKPKPLKFN